jgi:hypothetical protein
MTKLLSNIAKLTEDNIGWHIVTPLFNHFILPFSQKIGKDYPYWQAYSRELLLKSDLLIVLLFEETDISTSAGVKDEISLATEKGIPIIYVDGETGTQYQSKISGLSWVCLRKNNAERWLPIFKLGEKDGSN